MNKTIVFIIILVILLGVAGGAIYFLSAQESEVSKPVKKDSDTPVKKDSDTPVKKDSDTSIPDTQSTSATTPVTPAKNPFDGILIGQAVVCLNNKPDGVYRYTGNNTINWYPSPEIASSWDPNWDKPKTIDCSSGVIIGPPMEKNQFSGVPIGQAVVCLNNKPDGVYRYTGNNTINWYPTPEIAGSWDPNWGNTKTIDCSKGVIIGPPMEKKLSTFGWICNGLNKCLSVSGNSPNSGANVVQTNKSSDDSQQWSLLPSGNLCNKMNKCLAVSSNNSGNGASIIQWDQLPEEGQNWAFTANGNLCNKWNKCLASPGNSSDDNVALVQWDATAEQGQKWSRL